MLQVIDRCVACTAGRPRYAAAHSDMQPLLCTQGPALCSVEPRAVTCIAVQQPEPEAP